MRDAPEKHAVSRARRGAVTYHGSSEFLKPTGRHGIATTEAGVNNEGYIYFILASESGRIKIGKSYDPDARLRSLQTGHAEELRMLGACAVENMSLEERRLHTLFKPHHIRGEWFEPTSDIIDLARSFRTSGSVPRIGPKIRECPDVTPGATPPVETMFPPKAAAVKAPQPFEEIAPGFVFEEVFESFRTPVKVPAICDSWRVIREDAFDLWRKSEFDGRSSLLLDEGVESIRGAGYTTRAGTRNTARMLGLAAGNLEDVAAVLLLAIIHDISGRGRTLPEGWRGTAWQFVESCGLQALRRIHDKEWFEPWHRASSGAIPDMDRDINNGITPDSIKNLRFLLKAHASQVIATHQFVRIVSANKVNS